MKTIRKAYRNASRTLNRKANRENEEREQEVGWTLAEAWSGKLLSLAFGEVGDPARLQDSACSQPAPGV